MACSRDLKGMKILTMNYNGTSFEIMLDEGTYRELVSDKVLQNQYAKTVYESIFFPKKTSEQASQLSIQHDDPGQSQFSMINNVGIRGFTEESEELVSPFTQCFQPGTLLSLNRSKEPKNSLKHLISYQTSGFDSQAPSPSLLSPAETHTFPDKAIHFKWNISSTKLLLVVRLNMESEFCMPNCKKKKPWGKLADNLNQMLESNCVSGDTCDLKYRNLLGTYRVNKKKKQNTTGEGAVKWEFFEMMDEVLGHKASSAPQKQLLGSILDVGESSNASICQTSDNETAVESDALPAPMRKRQKIMRKKAGVSLNEYLFLKLEKENEKQMDQKERSEKKWAEKKELKLKEIDAINNLAAAIAGSHKNQTDK